MSRCYSKNRKVKRREINSDKTKFQKELEKFKDQTQEEPQEEFKKEPTHREKVLADLRQKVRDRIEEVKKKSTKKEDNPFSKYRMKSVVPIRKN